MNPEPIKLMRRGAAMKTIAMTSWKIRKDLSEPVRLALVSRTIRPRDDVWRLEVFIVVLLLFGCEVGRSQ